MVTTFLQLHHQVDETGYRRLWTFRQLLVVLGQDPPQMHNKNSQILHTPIYTCSVLPHKLYITFDFKHKNCYNMMLFLPSIMSDCTTTIGSSNVNSIHISIALVTIIMWWFGTAGNALNQCSCSALGVVRTVMVIAGGQWSLLSRWPHMTKGYLLTSQPSKSTQPGQPSMHKCSEQQQKLGAGR